MRPRDGWTSSTANSTWRASPESESKPMDESQEEWSGFPMGPPPESKLMDESQEEKGGIFKGLVRDDKQRDRPHRHLGVCGGSSENDIRRR